MAELFVVNGICGGTVFFLPDVPTVLGRSPECHVQVADPWISSMHALFERRGEQLWVVDLDSRNGTFVGEQRVHEAVIQPGARLRFGKTTAELRSHAEPLEPAGILSDQRTIIRYIADLSAEGGMSPLPPAGPPAAATSIAEAVVPVRGDEPRRETMRGASGGTGVARRHIGVLNEIGRSQLGASSLLEALQRLLHVLAGAVGAERSIVLLTDERGELKPITAEPADAPPSLSATVVDAALRSRAGILTLDAQQDLRFAQSQSVIAQGIRSCICAPIWADNRILGVLLLERGFSDPFTADDLELATLVGFQAALSVERLRIAERARAADEIHHRLLRHLDEAAAAPLLGTEVGERDPLEPALGDVAVLAVKLHGVDALAAGRPGPEAAQRILELQTALSAAARAQGAAVEERLGGGILAVFGLVSPPGEAAARAARCAAVLLARASELEGERGAPRLQVGAGIASGRALAGNFGTPERPDLRAVGGVVEQAERRAEQAKPGELLETSRRRA